VSDDDRTVFAPQSILPQSPASVPSSSAAFPPAPPPAPPAEPGRIRPGDVLNHIFEVKRFIARGGMGEVFEGVNVTSDERVAIKVMLPALAADENIQTMFRREARTLTRLSHPALVQYRVLAQEPQLGVLYIVTEYVDGANLQDVLGTLSADEAALTGLLRRLAAGLAAAHTLGAIHRDISPDNVLLEDGDLSRARVIDFGIAKDLDPGSKTVIGDGFAGKLSFVAPEQLGDFDREVGPWTDVYSLALVILAVAGQKPVDLGGSFVDAIDKRRRGVSLDAAPAGLRPVLERMLAPDPAKRIRSMDEVLDALAGKVAPPAPVPAPAKAKTKAPKPVKPAPAAGASPARKPSPALLAGGAAAALAVLAGGGWLLTRGGGGEEAAPVATAATPAGEPAAQRAAAAVAAALPGVGCSWLDLAPGGGAGGDSVSLKLTGVAGRPAEAQAAIARTVQGAGASLEAADFSDVAPISASECASVDAFRAVRAQGPAHLTVAQRSFEVSRLGPDSNYAGQVGARTVTNLDLSGVEDFALYGLEPSGDISPIIPNRKAFDALEKKGVPIADLGNGRYRFSIDANHTGWSGILLLTGRGGFSDKLVTGSAGSRGADWPQKFAAAAAANGWRSEMVWFKMVDEVPNGTDAPAAAPAAPAS